MSYKLERELGTATCNCKSNKCVLHPLLIFTVVTSLATQDCSLEARDDLGRNSCHDKMSQNVLKQCLGGFERSPSQSPFAVIAAMNGIAGSSPFADEIGQDAGGHGLRVISRVPQQTRLCPTKTHGTYQPRTR